MAFPLTQGAMEEWVRGYVQGEGFLKKSDMKEYLRAQRFVTTNSLRIEGYASGDDDRQTVIQLVADEKSQFHALRNGMQALLD